MPEELKRDKPRRDQNRGVRITRPFQQPVPGPVWGLFAHSCWSRCGRLLPTVLALVMVFVAANVAGQQDSDPPVPRNGTVDDTTVTLTFSEAVVSTATGALQIAFFVDGVLGRDGSVSPNAISIDGATVALTLATGGKRDKPSRSSTNPATSAKAG